MARRPMALSIETNDEDPYGDASDGVDLSESGRFSAGDFQIRPNGIVGYSSRDGRGPIDCDYNDLDIGKRLGKGASSVVFHAVHVPTGYEIALKTMPIADHASRSQMVNELRILRNLNNSDHLVKLFNAYSIDGDIVIALEYMDGGSLEGVFRAGAVPENVLQSIAVQIIQGLMDLHDCKNVHRDLKPANIMVNTQGFVKITDFGITRQLVTDEYAQTFVGTTVYMSPERIQNTKYNHQADIWSLGLILLEAAYGEYPYPTNLGVFDLMQRIIHSETPIEDFHERCVHEYSMDFVDFIDNCLQKDPKNRPDARELLGHPWLEHNRVDGRAFDDVKRYLHQTTMR